MLRLLRLTGLLLLLLLTGACQPIQPTAAMAVLPPAPASSPYFLRTACLYRIPPDANVTCGYVIVPE